MDAYTVSQAVAPVLLVHSKPPASIYPTAQKRTSRKIRTQESCIASVKHLWMSKPSISSAQNRSSNSLVQPFTRPEGDSLRPLRTEEKENAPTTPPHRRSNHIGACTACLRGVRFLWPARADAHTRPRPLGLHSFVTFEKGMRSESLLVSIQIRAPHLPSLRSGRATPLR